MAFSIPQDKMYHILAGQIAGFVGWHVALFFGFAPILGCIGLAVIAGAVKEGWDWYSNRKAIKAGLKPTHSVDPYDFLATVLGGLSIVGFRL